MVSFVRSRLAFVTLFWLIGMVAMAQSKYEKDILQHRKTKEKELMSKKHSPLSNEDRKRMDGLSFFQVDPEWNMTAMFSLISGGDTIAMNTSSGKSKTFVAYGTFVFEYKGKGDTLVAYKRVWPASVMLPSPETLFIPFTDYSTGETTYGGGRYLDVEVPVADGKVKLDFNLSYNPYCAYGDGFSCPIPPKCNFIQLFVEAGERQYAPHE